MNVWFWLWLVSTIGWILTLVTLRYAIRGWRKALGLGDRLAQFYTGGEKGVNN